MLSYHAALLQIDRYVSDQNFPPLNNFERFVIALEDRGFFAHPGVSIRGFLREFWRVVRGKRHGGASTIDMQLFRTISGRYERTISRKIFEIGGALLLQRHYSKKEILRIYLSVAYFGTGLEGAEEASLNVFGKPPDHLSKEEAATIASLLVYPKPSVPTADWSAKVSRRAQYGQAVLSRFEKQFEQMK